MTLCLRNSNATYGRSRFYHSDTFQSPTNGAISGDALTSKIIPAGTIVELVGNTGNTSLKVRVDIFIEQMYSDEREKAVSGEFTFVAIDENKKPIKIE